MEIPLVTIGITSFNAADTINFAIESALKQNWQLTELVVVDDCSQDQTPKVLEALASEYPEIRVLFNSINMGVEVSRNRILQAARGEFVAFFDDDDESLPDRIGRQLTRILEYEREHANGAMVLCHTARLVKYPDGSERIQPTIGQREGRRAPHGIAVAKRAILGTPLEDGYGSCPTCSQMARLSTYRAVKGFDSDFRRAGDSDLLVRVAKAGGHIVGIADPLVIQTMTNTVDKSLAAERQEALMLLEKHRDIADEKGLYDFCRRWLIIKYVWFEQDWRSFLARLMMIGLNYPSATLFRLFMSLRNLGINLSFSKFHLSAKAYDD